MIVISNAFVFSTCLLVLVARYGYIYEVLPSRHTQLDDDMFLNTLFLNSDKRFRLPAKLLTF